MSLFSCMLFVFVAENGLHGQEIVITPASQLSEVDEDNEIVIIRNEKKYRYDTEFQFEADHYFMKFVLCEEQPKIYSIQKLLALHRRRSDNANLNTKWFKGFSWRHIQRHYKVTGSLKGTIMFSFNRLFVPDAILMPLKLKMYDFQPLTNMKNDDFLKVFYDFLVVGDNTNNGTK